MTITLIVEEKKETIEHQSEVTLRGEGEHRFAAYCTLRARLHPEIAQLAIGDRLRVTLDKIAPVSEVERTINEAEAHGLAAASLV